MTELFFDYLGSRFRKENDLSDVTWALCKTSENFTKLFLGFFFKESIDFSRPVSIEREFASGESRPDFRVLHGDDEFIIENKIYDRNLQFEKYQKDFSNAKEFGYITNYKVSPINGYEIKTWEDFKDFIEFKITNGYFDENLEHKNLVSGYLKFVENICSLIKIEKMNLENLSSLFHFNSLLKTLLREPFNGFEVYEWNQTKNHESYQSGQSFRLKKENGDKSPIYGWVGVYFHSTNESVNIYVCFNENGSGSLCSDLKAAKTKNELTEGLYYDAPWYEDNAFWFMLKKQHFAKFTSKTEADVTEQRKIIRDFMEEVFISTQKYL